MPAACERFELLSRLSDADLQHPLEGVGVGLTLVSGGVAVLTHGPIRKAFATIAIARTVLSIGLAVLLTGASDVTGAGTVTRL